MEIKTKYGIGDRLWGLMDKKPVCITVESVLTRTDGEGVTAVTYASKETFGDYLPLDDEPIFHTVLFDEGELFPTEEELLMNENNTDKFV